jgi:hypothetical protein
MANLTRASRELFVRPPDEQFKSFQDLSLHCQREKERSSEYWQAPQLLAPKVDCDAVVVAVGEDDSHLLNDWSFTQLYKLAGVSKDTINRLHPETASRALRETIPSSEKPMQLLRMDQTIRSLHGVSYTRLWNADLLATVGEFATDFQPPPAGFNGATGLYCGEQDLFAFMIDPDGWIEIGGEEFAPGFFVWNSEVGRRSLGIQAFWYQRICMNHIVWDATEVIEFTRKHTANVQEGLGEIRRIIAQLVERRDVRKDGFYRVVTRAMSETFGPDEESVAKELAKHGIPRGLIKDALPVAAELGKGRYTIFGMVDALTRLTPLIKHVGDRTEAEAKVASLLSLAV